MGRTPPVEIRRMLRREVGFGCPVPDCGNPYLEYHHFDPEYAVEPHFRPEGMIALCVEHHRKAGGGAFTASQLRVFKRGPPQEVRGRFDWLRQNVIAVVGGNFFYETPVIVRYDGEPQIWYERDGAGNLLFSLRMISTIPGPRLVMDRNDWLLLGDPKEFECPPSGRRIHAAYEGGDRLTIEFLDLPNLEAAVTRYRNPDGLGWPHIAFPVTAVEITEVIGDSGFGYTPSRIRVPGLQMEGSWGLHSGTGLSWGSAT